MRSFIVKAAIAATLASIPLSVGYAGDSAPYMADRPTAHSPSEFAPSQASRPRSFGLANPLSYRSDRLATIESALGQAMQQVNFDRRRGALSPGEARFVRHEGAAVHSEALDVARRNGGQIPAASYAMLRDRVADLKRTIRRYEAGAAQD
jgi:hypothetical protein